MGCTHERSSIKNLSDDEICKMIISMVANDQKIRLEGNFGSNNEVDVFNTKTLIEIVKLKGWPSKDRYNCDEHPGGAIIFRHAPQRYFKEIESLIKKEYLAGRMQAGDYNLIKNHLDGRPVITSEQLLKEPVFNK